MYIYYHSQDTDGRTSGALAMMQYPDATILPLNYNQEISECRDHNIIFIDITPSIQWLINNTNKDIYIYDHHLDAYNKIQQLHLNNVHYMFDNDHCGAVIFYKAHAKLHNDYLDRFLEYVDMYDTGKVRNAHNKDNIFSFSEYMYRKSVSDIQWIIQHKYNIDDIISDGDVLRLDRLNVITSQFKQGSVVTIADKKWFACAGQPSYYLVDMVETSCKECDGLLTYYTLNDKQYKISLRSNSVDCNKYIKYINQNGGGHKEAAGCVYTKTN